MKKILLLFTLFLLVGCQSESKEIVKIRLNDNEKLEFKLTNDQVYHFVIDGGFVIYKDEKEFVNFRFLDQEECTSIIASENLDIVEKKDNGFIYKDEIYHYLHDSNKGMCLLINSDDVSKVNEVLSNSEINVIEEQ